MCYRFFLKASDLKAAARKLKAALEKEAETRYNIAPGSPISTVRKKTGSSQRETRSLNWGLVPSWAKDAASMGTKLANARAETLTEKPSFREAFAKRRCIIPASGFFEWETNPEGKKIPWLFARADASPLLFAGLWELWTDPAGLLHETCTLITTEPNKRIRMIHDRMPVILPDDACDLWLDEHTGTAQASTLLCAFPEDAMTDRRVDPWVNSIAHDDDRCIAPWSPDSETQLGLSFD